VSVPEHRSTTERRAEADERAQRRAGPVPPAVVRRRRIVALAGVGAVVLATGVWAAGSGSSDPAGTDGAKAARVRPAALPQLPGGGRRIFPGHRVVAYYGNPQDEELGALGVGKASTMLANLRRQARPYARRTRPVLPALELIATVAASDPGPDGAYVVRAPDAVIARYLKLARRAKALLILDVQPGRSNFPAEVARLLKWLKEPDVSLALDPEWRVGPDAVPGQVIGSVAATEVNAVSAELARIVQAGRLPQKLFVIHQFTDGMVTNPQAVARRPGLATVFNVDGFGNRADKVSKYRALVTGKAGFHHGFKLFYKEDLGLMKPRSVMALQPRPDLVVYE
jgi:hypothetical protein